MARSPRRGEGRGRGGGDERCGGNSSRSHPSLPLRPPARPAAPLRAHRFQPAIHRPHRMAGWRRGSAPAGEPAGPSGLCRASSTDGSSPAVLPSYFSLSFRKERGATRCPKQQQKNKHSAPPTPTGGKE